MVVVEELLDDDVVVVVIVVEVVVMESAVYTVPFHLKIDLFDFPTADTSSRFSSFDK